MIDGVLTSTIGLHTLRQKMSIIPQVSYFRCSCCVEKCQISSFALFVLFFPLRLLPWLPVLGFVLQNVWEMSNDHCGEKPSCFDCFCFFFLRLAFKKAKTSEENYSHHSGDFWKWDRRMPWDSLTLFPLVVTDTALRKCQPAGECQRREGREKTPTACNVKRAVSPSLTED